MSCLHLPGSLALAVLLVACSPATPAGPADGAPTQLVATPAAPPKPAAASASPSPSPSPSPAPLAEVPVRIAVTAADAAQWPLLVAESKGMFRRYAVRASLARLAAGEAVDRVRAGQLDLIAGSAESAIAFAEQGAPIRLIAGLINAPAYSLVAARDVGSIADLRGRPVAVADLKSARAALLRRMLIAGGLKADEVILVDFGTAERELAAVVNGTAGAALVEQPRAAQLVRQRFRSLLLASDAVPDYQSDALAARQQWLATGDGPAQFLRAIQEADAWLYEPRNKQEAAVVLADALKIAPQEALDAYEVLVEKGQAIPRAGELNPAGVRTVADLLVEVDALRRPAPDLTRLVDTTALDRARTWTR